MIAQKYEPAFAALSPEQIDCVIRGLSRTRPELLELNDFDSGADIVSFCRQTHVSHAEVVMSMRHDPSPLAVSTVEALIMKSIDRRTPSQVEREREAALPPRPVVATVRSSERTTDQRIIRVLAATNPKRAGTASYDRFQWYVDGMTVAAYMAKGGGTADIKWDTEKGFIRIDPAV